MRVAYITAFVLTSLVYATCVSAMDQWVNDSIQLLEEKQDALFYFDVSTVKEINQRATDELESDPNNVHLWYLKGRTERNLRTVTYIQRKKENQLGDFRKAEWYRSHHDAYIEAFRRALEIDEKSGSGNKLTEAELISMDDDVIMPPDLVAEIIRLQLERLSPRGENWHWNQYTAMVTAYHSANQFTEAQSVLDEMLKVRVPGTSVRAHDQSCAFAAYAVEEGIHQQDDSACRSSLRHIYQQGIRSFWNALGGET